MGCDTNEHRMTSCWNRWKDSVPILLGKHPMLKSVFVEVTWRKSDANQQLDSSSPARYPELNGARPTSSSLRLKASEKAGRSTVVPILILTVSCPVAHRRLPCRCLPQTPAPHW